MYASGVRNPGQDHEPRLLSWDLGSLERSEPAGSSMGLCRCRRAQNSKGRWGRRCRAWICPWWMLVSEAAALREAGLVVGGIPSGSTPCPRPVELPSQGWRRCPAGRCAHLADTEDKGRQGRCKSTRFKETRQVEGFRKKSRWGVDPSLSPSPGLLLSSQPPGPVVPN